MRRKRVSVLYEIWWPDDRPQPAHTLLGKRPLDGPSDPEPDVHEEVYNALGRIGYAPQYAVLEGDAASLAKLATSRTSLVFNLTESYAGDDTKDLHVAAFLELIGKPFTGCDARALHLGQDKVLAKKILRFHDVPTPDFTSVARGTKRIEHHLQYPLIVKPSREDGSIGIDTGSVVHDDKALRERVRYIHATFAGPALVERYVEGREIYVAILGNDPPEALPLVELDLSGVPDGVPRIAGTEVKWWKGSEIYRKTPPVYPKNLSRPLTRRIQKIAVGAFRSLGLRDYARVDLRVTESGDVFVIEVNPNPWLSSECEYFMAWKKTGRNYDELIARLVELAFERGSNGA
jgi:D-alanine-D-alanine ligase